MAFVLATGTQIVRADHEKENKAPGTFERSANDLIGKKVTNAQNEDLGKVQDIIVNVDQGTAPYAILSTGGILAGRSRVAVALNTLQCAPDGKSVMITATKAELQAASKTPTGAWAATTECEWAKNVDAYYGDPAPSQRYTPTGLDSRTDYRTRATNDSRTILRDPVPKGAEVLMAPQDQALCEKICETVDVVNVRVHNGVTHVYGTVDSDEQRKNIENRLRTVPGVISVESHIRVKNP